MSEEIQPTEQSGTQTPEAAPKPAARGGMKKRHKALLVLLMLFVVGGGLGLRWWIKGKTHIETDNAFIEANVVSISARVPGMVKRVLVRDNQFVRKGELLVELDESDYRAQVSRATAGVGVASNETSGEQLKAEGARASLELSRARLEQADLDLRRGESLFSREVIPKEQLDRLKTARRIAESQHQEAREALKRAQAEAGLVEASSGKAKVRERQAQLEQASLQLSYTRIFAPTDGYVTRKGVEPGANIQAGQPLLALVPLQDAWITANYKEGQMSHIKAGQKVEFRVDAYPGKTFTGRVDSVMAGTGAAFSLLPPENATGNYVKVVQRIPVKIAIDGNSDPEHLLRVGMSVIPTVLTERPLGDVLRDLKPFR